MTFFNFGGCVFPVSPGAPGDQEPDSHQCSTPAETSQALILATVINSNALWPSVLEGRIPQLLRSLNLTSDHIWDTKECDGTQCVRKAKWNVTVHIICGGGLCGSTEKIISDFNPLCSTGENPLFVFFWSCFCWISAEKATLLAQSPDYYKWLLYPCKLLRMRSRNRYLKLCFERSVLVSFHQTACFFQWADAWITVQLKSQGRMFDGVTGTAVPRTYLSLLERLVYVALGYKRDRLVRWSCRDSRCSSTSFEFALQSIKSMKGANQIRDKQHGGRGALRFTYINGFDRWGGG